MSPFITINCYWSIAQVLGGMYRPYIHSNAYASTPTKFLVQIHAQWPGLKFDLFVTNLRHFQNALCSHIWSKETVFWWYLQYLKHPAQTIVSGWCTSVLNFTNIIIRTTSTAGDGSSCKWCWQCPNDGDSDDENIEDWRWQ